MNEVSPRNLASLAPGRNCPHKVRVEGDGDGNGLSDQEATGAREDERYQHRNGVAVNAIASRRVEDRERCKACGQRDPNQRKQTRIAMHSSSVDGRWG